MKLKILTYCILFSFSLNCIAQTTLKFNYECSRSVVEETRVSVLLKSSTDKIELLNDTVRNFENSWNIPSKENDYILLVEFENKAIEKEEFNHPFSLDGNETEIEINVSTENYNRKERPSGRIEVIKYYKSNNIDIQYLPEMKGNEYYKPPFFMLTNNSNDTIYGQYLSGHFWGWISYLIVIDFDGKVDSIWTGNRFGILDYEFVIRSPLFPDSTAIAQVGSFGWRSELPKTRYKYTLLYTTDENMNRGVTRRLEKNNFVWWADTRKYYRLIYEFDVK